MKFKALLLIILFLLSIPSVLADIIAPSPGQYALFYLVIFIINYVVNVVLIGIQSKIWLHLGFKKIAVGLAIITPIMFVVEGIIVWVFDSSYFRVLSVLYIRNTILLGLLAAILNFLLIFACYLFLAKHFWNCEKKQAITTAIIMGILTNPGFYFLVLVVGDFIISRFSLHTTASES